MQLSHPLLRGRIKEEPGLAAALPSLKEVSAMSIEAFELRLAEVEKQRALSLDERDYVAQCRRRIKNKEYAHLSRLRLKEKIAGLTWEDGGRLSSELHMRIDELERVCAQKDAEIKELNGCVATQRNAYLSLLSDHISQQQELHMLREHNTALLFVNATLAANK